MKKWTKLFSLAIGALMAIGAAVGVKQTVERVNAENFGTFTITRSSFPSGALAYKVTDAWSTTSSTGETITGEGDLYSSADQTTMQTRDANVSTMFHNTSATPGPITKIEMSCASGTARTYTAYLNKTSVITSTSGGTSKGTIAAPSGGSASLELNIEDDWRFFWLNCAGGASYLNSITITYACPSEPEDAAVTDVRLIASENYVSEYGIGDSLDKTGLSVVADYGSQTDLSWKKENVDVTDNPDVNWNFSSEAVGDFNLTVTFDGITSDDVIPYSIVNYSLVTIAPADEMDPALPTTSGGVNKSATLHSDSTSGISFYETKVYNSSSNYLMFVENAGFIYNKTSLGTILSVSVSYSSGTSTSGKIGVYFGNSLMSSYITTDNKQIAGQSKTDVFANSIENNGFFQVSSSNKNVQIVSIQIKYRAALSGIVASFNAGLSSFVEDSGESVATGEDSLTVTLPTISDFSEIPYKYSTFLGWDIDDDGVVDYDATETSVTITESTNFVAVFGGKTLSIAEALEVCEIAGTSASLVAFSVSGIVTKITVDYSEEHNNISFMISDGKNEILCFRAVGGKDISAGKCVTVSGSLVTYSGTKEFASGCTYEFSSEYHTVTFDYDDDVTDALTVIVKHGETCKEPTRPSRTGFNFVGWFAKNSDTAFSFVTSIASDLTLYAHWEELGSYEKFADLPMKAALGFAYSDSGFIINEPFKGTAGSQTTLPTGWSGTVGGTYTGEFWQSFRNNGNNVESPEFEKSASVQVSLDVYLNNTGNSGNKSSKIKLEALNKSGTSVDSYQTDNLNNLSTGVANKTTISHTLTGENIVSVKISFVKDGGGNIAFSNVSISSHSYSLKTDENGKSKTTLQFGTFLDADLYDELIGDGSNEVSFGMLYSLEGNFDSETVSEILNVEECSLSDLASEYDVFYKECSPELNKDGDYQFGISISGIPNSDLGTGITSCAYMCVDGVYYLTADRTESVQSLAAKYVAPGVNTSAYSDYVDVLTWLSTYGA